MPSLLHPQTRMVKVLVLLIGGLPLSVTTMGRKYISCFCRRNVSCLATTLIVLSGRKKTRDKSCKWTVHFLFLDHERITTGDQMPTDLVPRTQGTQMCFAQTLDSIYSLYKHTVYVWIHPLARKMQEMNTSVTPRPPSWSNRSSAGVLSLLKEALLHSNTHELHK